MRVAVVAEFYPRAADPVLGIWAHRQALAAREAGADVRVLVLQRPIPARADLANGPRAAANAMRTALAQPRHSQLDGLDVRYVPFLSPPRGRTYGSWGAWAAPGLALALRGLRREFPYDLVHAHYAVPAGDAVRRARAGRPLVVSVHGGDVLWTVHQGTRARCAVERTFAAARVVLANSGATADLCRRHGAREVAVVHLGADPPTEGSPMPHRDENTVVSVGHLVARKRHGDVVRALWLLRDRHPQLRYVVVGDGPERESIASLAGELGVSDRVELRGQLEPADALRAAWSATVFALPSVDEAFGVAYIEAMAGGVPAIGCRGEGGPEEIARAGGGMLLVAPGDVEALAAELDKVLSDARFRRELSDEARATVAAHFTWEHCGAQTVGAYEAALT